MSDDRAVGARLFVTIARLEHLVGKTAGSTCCVSRRSRHIGRCGWLGWLDNLRRTHFVHHLLVGLNPTTNEVAVIVVTIRISGRWLEGIEDDFTSLGSRLLGLLISSLFA